MQSPSVPTDQNRPSWHGCRTHHIIQDYLSNSSHFPAANLILELLIHGRAALFEPATYALLLGGSIQAIFLGNANYHKRNLQILGNLIGPTIYTIIEVIFEGPAFFDTPNHWAYWGYSIFIGIFSYFGATCRGRSGEPFVVLEHLARTSIMFGTYWSFEIITNSANNSIQVFFSDGSHVFFLLAVTLLGLIIGFEGVSIRRRTQQVSELTSRLEEYSEWLLGRALLNRALDNPTEALGLRRRQRHVLFMDIRGFTSWSEEHTPEVVVEMLNRYFSTSEAVWQSCGAIKTKYTGDEVMAVFEEAEQATKAATEFMLRIGPLLQKENLGVGIGIHGGPLMEGALGSEKIKAYDVIGDTVNTAKRLCDNAEAGEILVSSAVLDALEPNRPSTGASRTIRPKGKREPMVVFPLTIKG